MKTDTEIRLQGMEALLQRLGEVEAGTTRDNSGNRRRMSLMRAFGVFFQKINIRYT